MKNEKNVIETLNKEIEILQKKVEELKTSEVKCLSLAQQLERTNIFNNALLASIPFGMDIVDSEGNILFMNRKLQIMFGSEAIGKKCWAL